MRKEFSQLSRHSQLFVSPQTTHYFFWKRLLQFRLSVCIFVSDRVLAQFLTSLLSCDRYITAQVSSARELIQFVEENKEQIDCLIVLNHPSLQPVFNQFYEKGTLLPAILIEFPTSQGSESDRDPQSTGSPTYFYHSAEIQLRATELEAISSTIDQAIAQFLHLGPSCPLSERPTTTIKVSEVENQQSFLLLQQRRLAEKLKERLGYLGVYYKRNPQYFYRNLSQADKKELLAQLSSEYREIILTYFAEDSQVNQEIDRFVSHAFFADISASQILEIHMELMDEFAQQLKLEGRNEEILLDYRLALIDILAHIGEMYRRSIPREDIPFELLYRID